MKNWLQNPAVQKAQRFIPAASFFGGFAWDSLTLGKLVQTSDLAFLLIYYLASLAMLILLSAQKTSLSEKCKNLLTWGVQFCFGSLSSALVVCYFKSSSSLGAFLIVAVLAAILVGNEFLQKRYASFGLSLALFHLLGSMYLNFLIPHLANGMGFFWFFLSILISLGICLLTFKFSHATRKVLVAPAGISAALLLAYAANWIPPVPLVLKDQNACIGFSKNYSCQIDRPGILESAGLRAQTLTLSKEAPGVAFVSSVFAPAKIEAPLEHRWYLENPKTGKFELVNRISSERMRTRGSRAEGFRIYTVKKNVPAGKWKVETAVKGGSVIGSKTFYVKSPGEFPVERERWQIR